MKKILTLLLLVVSLSAFSQDTYLQTGSEDLQEKAKAITDKYVDVLGLRAEQELLFRKKVEEYLVREEKIKATNKGEDMLNKMVALRQNEAAEMGDILTRLQLQKYKEVRPEIQPLARVKQ
tara:strand:- start:8961 stop:9323 length:363 start_codon:yes stop_codon:yes gene_type:complete